MNDGQVEYHTMGEFLDWCVLGRKYCEEQGQIWTSIGKGAYIHGGMVDQRFMPLISEGKFRLLMTGDTLIRIEHLPYGKGSGISEVISTPYPADEPKFANLVETFLPQIPHYMEAMGLENEDLPAFWTSDFIKASADEYVICEMNASCVCIMELYGAMGSSFEALSAENQKNGQDIANMIGATVVKELKARG